MPRIRPRSTRLCTAGVVALATSALVSAVFTSPAQAAATSGAVVSFTFDDGRTNQYTNARPLLDSAGFRGTFFIISDALTWGSSYLTANQVRAMAADGQEIGNHTRTHANLTKLSRAEVRSEFQKSQSKIAARVGVTPRSCAYPYGASNATVESVAAEFFRSCRSTDGGTNKKTTNRFRLRTYYVHSSTTAAQIRSAVARAKAEKVWLILSYHGVGKVNSSDDVSRETFAAHVTAVKASGVPVRTISQVTG